MKTNKSIKKNEKISKIIAYIVLAFASLTVLFPFLVIFSTSFKSITEAQTLPFYFIPKEFNFLAEVSPT